MTPRKPRKMPKNQRAYPKGKPQLVEVTGAELALLINGLDDISCPPVFKLINGAGGFYCDAGKLRKWRSSRGTSSAEQT